MLELVPKKTGVAGDIRKLWTGGLLHMLDCLEHSSGKAKGGEDCEANSPKTVREALDIWELENSTSLCGRAEGITHFFLYCSYSQSGDICLESTHKIEKENMQSFPIMAHADFGSVDICTAQAGMSLSSQKTEGSFWLFQHML